MPGKISTYREITASLSAGLVVGVLALFLQASFAAMIFSGELAPYLAQGMGILLLGALIMGLIVTIMSSYASSIAMPQDSTAALMGVVAAAIVATMSMEVPSISFATVVAAMMVSSVITGLLLSLLGHYNLGRLVRFMPFPVVGGFLAGTGWILFTGGLSVMSDGVLGADLFTAAQLPRWIPGLLFAFTILLLTRRYSHFLLMPGLLGTGTALFYLGWFLVHKDLNSTGIDSWLLGPFPTDGLFQPVTTLALTQADWGVVLDNSISLGIIFIVGTISLLLNATGLEIATRSSVNLNRELKAVGIANIAAGMTGSSVGYHMLSVSTLGHRLNANSRLLGLVSATVIACALFFGASLLATIPKLVAGGFLLFLGLAFLSDWLYDAWFKVSRMDYLLIWLILIVVILFGMLQGVAVGILISIFLFVTRYSTISNVRHVLSRRNFQSYVMRPPTSEAVLRQHGRRLAIFELQGFIFFGSAYTLVEQLGARIAKETNEINYLLLDFRLVANIDSSASLSFSRLKQVLDDNNITLIFSNLSESIRNQLRDNIAGTESNTPVHIFPDLDQGVAWVEEQLLSDHADSATDIDSIPVQAASFLDYFQQTLYRSAKINALEAIPNQQENEHQNRLLQFMDRLDVVAGTVLLTEGEFVDRAYFIEQGQIIIYTDQEDGSRKPLRILKPGTVFGEIGIYSGQKATATVAAKDTSVLYSLSSDSLSRMEREDATLAIAVHRLIAENLGRKLTQASYTIRALQT